MCFIILTDEEENEKTKKDVKKDEKDKTVNEVN